MSEDGEEGCLPGVLWGRNFLTFWVAVSGSNTPPTDLDGGTIFSTKTRSRRGISFFARLMILKMMVKQ